MTYADTRLHAVLKGRELAHNRDLLGFDLTGMCQKITRTLFRAGPGSPDARSAWLTSDKRDRHPLTMTTPIGVPLYFKGGKHWHVAVYSGRKDGVHMCLSNDVRGRGSYAEVPVSRITEGWGYPIVGWLSRINGKRIQGKKLPGE